MSDVGYRLEQIKDDDARLHAEAQLLSSVFPNTDRYTFEYLKWQYFENPDGEAVGFDAYSDDGLAAHYVTLPFEALLFGERKKGVLSLNTATHPNHQGKGLFVRLADASYSLARDLGYDFVVGVANANSTPGFVRKLGFQLVSQLAAEVGVGTVVATSEQPVEFKRIWSESARTWRLQNPAAQYFEHGSRIYATTANSLIKMQLTIDPWDEAASRPMIGRLITGWLGLHPSRRWQGIALPVPQRLRPSPLNLIFRDLSGRNRQLDASRVIMNGIDFDAY